MPTYLITSPDGKKYKVTGPGTKEEALAQVQAQLGQGGEASPPQELTPAAPPLSPAAQEFEDFASGATQNPAAAQYEQLPAWQKPLVAANDIVTMTANGATFGFGDKIAAGARSVFKGSPYEQELAEQRRQTQGSRNRSGWAGTAAELTGGVRSAMKVAGAGLTGTRFAGAAAPGLPRLAAVIGGSAADGTALGTVSALGNDTDVGTAAATGAVLGGLTPAAFAILRNTFAPLFARMNPERAANSAIETLVARSGRTPQEIVQELEAAAREGQGGVFTAADAMGQPAQRMLSTIARTPGDARAGVVNALEARQAGQGRRISQQLEEGFGSPQTAAQTETARIQLRRTEGNANYGAARAQAQPVDVSAARDALDDIVRPGISKMIGTGAAENSSVYGKLARMRDLLGRNNSRVTDWDRALMAKVEMDAIIEQGGSAAALLRPARNALDDALSNASAPYAKARDTYRQGSRNIEAVDTGRTAARRGRVEDTIPAFLRMKPGEQAGFRAGYVDPLIESTQGAAVGVNKARPLVNDATAAEFPAFAAPGRGPILQRQIGREQTMFETRNAALGGSKTADNLADQADLALFDPTILGNLVTGNWGAAAASLGRRSLANIQGLSPGVRNRIASLLVERSPTVGGRRIAQAIAQGRRLTQRELRDLRVLMVTGVAASNSTSRKQ